MSAQSSITTLNHTRFVEQARYQILNPLQLDNEFGDIVPLIIIATEFVRLGWLRSMHGLENYLLFIAEVCKFESTLLVLC